MKRVPGAPFFLSALLTATVALPLLHLRDARSFSPSPATAPASRENAFFEARMEVAHAGNALHHSMRTALQWLERHQHAEGMWSARSYAQLCSGDACTGRGTDDHDLGVTALAVLAMLEAGMPRHRESARRGLDWLASRQDRDGSFGASGAKSIYGPAVATMAFVRAYPLMGESVLKHHAARGVMYLQRAQHSDCGWGYSGSDTSVTAWAVAALAAAMAPDVDIPVEGRALEGALRWLDGATDDRAYEARYRRRDDGHWERSEGASTAALRMRMVLGQDRELPEVRGSARQLGWRLPHWREGADFTAWFSGTSGLAAYGGKELWEEWSSRVGRALVGNQRRFNEGCAGGSWDPIDRWGSEGGRVYATAMNLLTLSVLDRSVNASASQEH